MSTLLARLEEEFDVTGLDFVQSTLLISRLPYRRPTERSAAGVVAEGCGTCSTKHMLLAALARENWPEHNVLLWHRVYDVSPHLARTLWGADAARVVPVDGLVDVHTFATMQVQGAPVLVDATFAVEQWDGVSDMTLACGPGDDYPAGEDVLGTKADLVERWCDPATREPFIEHLARMATP